MILVIIPMRSIFNSIKILRFSQLIQLMKINLAHPLFALLTLLATYWTLRISKKYFPQTHHLNGKGNAFRHALWNCLIMMYCCKISSPKKALYWCEKITLFHENTFPNTPLQRQMDLHNNQVGRGLFLQMLPTIHRQFFERSFFINPLLKLTDNAEILNNKNNISKNSLVYIP